MKLTMMALVLFVVHAHAVETSKTPFKVKKGEVIDLVQEAGELRVLTEKAIQVDKKTSDMSLGVHLGNYKPKSVIVETNGLATKYNFKSAAPFVQMQFQHFPIHFAGKFGYSARIGYFEQQQTAEFSTRLHAIPTELGLLYKFERTGNEIFSPLLGVNYTKFLLFQRGVDQKNTSEQSGASSYIVGANFNLNQMGLLKNSRNQMDFSVVYQNFYSSETTEKDWRGSAITAGVSMNL